jgi:hypothetical protein
MTQAESETTASTTGPPATETETQPTPTPTPSPTPEPVTFAIQNAPNETVAEDQLQTAVRQWQDSGMLTRPANVTDSLITADYRVVFRPTVESCQGERTDGTFYWCVQESSQLVEVTSRYIPSQQVEFTERAVGSVLVGEDYDNAPFYEEVNETQLKTPFLKSGPITVAPAAEDGEVNAIEYAALQDAVTYWNGNASAYNITWQADFQLINNTGRADVEVRFVKDVQRCPDSDDVLGCAPRFEEGEYVERQAQIRIKQGYTQQSTETIIRHEFGHLLGLTHGQEPLPLMNETYDARLAGDVPDLETREYGFDDTVLPVYVDYESFDADQERVREEIVQTMEWYEAGNVEQAPSNLQLNFTQDIDKAAFVIRYNQTLDDEGFAYRIQPYGRSVDADEPFEYYTHGVFRFGSDVDTLSYYFAKGAGYMIANTATLDDAPPDGVRDSEYEEWPE